jgi:hypothetical protein
MDIKKSIREVVEVEIYRARLAEKQYNRGAEDIHQVMKEVTQTYGAVMALQTLAAKIGVELPIINDALVRIDGIYNDLRGIASGDKVEE